MILLFGHLRKLFKILESEDLVIIIISDIFGGYSQFMCIFMYSYVDITIIIVVIRVPM
jgi:hypothetical protein